MLLNPKYTGDIDELNHVLLAVWCNDLYETQIDSIIEHYGKEAVMKAEEVLYASRVFQLIIG